MSRKEEIERAWLAKSVQSNHRYDEQTFKEAVEWADKTMIEKACEHLAKVLPGEVDFLSNADIIITNFRKAMEE